MTIVLNGDSGITTPTYGGADTSEYLVPVTAFKNRIINGAMVIDQRNAGASVTQGTTNTYCIDRWIVVGSQASKFTIQQNTADAPTSTTGFATCAKITSSSAYTVGASEIFFLIQKIEGFNQTDIGWGTPNAQAVTLSFWVRSSLTGTFGGSLINAAETYTFPFSYTISLANTWQQVSITVPAQTNGAWQNNSNGIGIQLIFSMGCGSSLQATANTWTTGSKYAPTGATNLVSTNGATFYITGVQLEVGSTATSFDYRPYGTELALCQRYFCSSFSIGTAPAQNAGGGMIGKGANGATAEPILTWSFPVSMRAAPTVTTYNPSAANNQWSAGSAPRVVTNSTAFVSIDNTGNAVTAGTQSYINASASIEL